MFALLVLGSDEELFWGNSGVWSGDVLFSCNEEDIDGEV